MPAGVEVTGEMPSGAELTGEMSAGAELTGEMPAGAEVTGEMPAGAEVTCEMPAGAELRTGGAGVGDPDPGGTPSGDTGNGGANSEETGGGGTTSAESTPPPRRHDTRYQAACRRAREEQERLEGELQELPQLDLLEQQQPPPPPPPPQPQQLPVERQLFPPVSGLRALGLPSSPPVHSQSPPAFGPAFSPLNGRRVVWSSPPTQSPPPVVRHYCSRPCPPSARPSSLVADLHTALLRTSLRRSPPPVFFLPSPPPSSLPVSPTPISEYYHAVHPVVSRVLATVVTDPRFSPSSISALTTTLADFATASRLDHSTHVVPAPPTRPLSVGDDGMWLFKVKRPPGSPPVFKAPYVARGFSQREGVDFFQTFAPTPKMTTLRVLLHVAAQRDYELHSLDFSTVFLQGQLHEEILLQRPPGFRPSSAYLSLFVRTGSTPFFILVYVDNFVFATPDRAALTELGLQITKDRAACTITLTQSHMVQHVLQRFGFQFSTTQPTPLAVDHRPTSPFPDEPFEPSGPYPELVACLMYLMTCSRSDLAYPLSVLSCFVGPRRPCPVHWTAAVRVAKYLVTTSGTELVLGGTRPVELTGLCDSSYADDVETQRSTQGYCFSLGAGAVSWRSTRSSSVASSSA
ncbi:unnamed protein product [Closterium sp. NIES-54]